MPQTALGLFIHSFISSFTLLQVPGLALDSRVVDETNLIGKGVLAGPFEGTGGREGGVMTPKTK